MSHTSPRLLTCCCCGESTLGRQWGNRDIGYGLCEPCATWLPAHDTTDEDMRELYGIQGVHYALTADPPRSPFEAPSAETSSTPPL